MRFRILIPVAALLVTTLYRPNAASAEEQRPWGPPPPEVTNEPQPAENPPPPEESAPAEEPESPTEPPQPEPAPTQAQPQETDVAPAPQPQSAEIYPESVPTEQAPSEGTSTTESPAEGEDEAERGVELRNGMINLRYRRFTLDPMLILVGGMQYHHIMDNEESRFVTVALSRFGLVGNLGSHVSIRSVFEVNAGPHGTSVWEGQAAMSVLDQLIHLHFGRFELDVGRIVDPASLDYTSTHVANMLLTDQWIRTPFLYSGANRGNGVLAKVRIWEGLKVNFNVNAGHPLSYTGTSMFGGTYGILPRFYFEPQRSVSEDARTFPDDQYYAVLISPSITFDWTYLRAQFSYQLMWVDVTRNSEDNPLARGQNFRGGLQGLFWQGRIRPFFNFSYITNHTFDTGASNQPIINPLSAELFEGYTVGAGIDVDFLGNTGIGVQYNLIREQTGDPDADAGGPIVYNHFLNIGASWWFLPWICVEARYAFTTKCENTGDGANCSGPEDPENPDIHLSPAEHNIFLTLRGVFGLEESQRRAQSL